MLRFTRDRTPLQSHYGMFSTRLRRYFTSSWTLLLAAPIITLSACGGSSSSAPKQSASLAGNWQFTMTKQTDGNPNDPTFGPGLQGGFLLQNTGSSVTGQAVYSVQSSSSISPCNSGSAAITATTTGGQTVLTAVAGNQTLPGTQTFTLTVTQADASTMSGTYTSTAPAPGAGGSVCGYGTAGTWSAFSVPPLTGSITGSFHSGSPGAGLLGQDFPVTGTLTQGPNIGASNATVIGTLSFIDPTTLISDYPCIPGGLVSVNGQISGSTVILQLIGIDGSNAGQIGTPASQANLGGDGFEPVNLEPALPSGYILHSTGLGYVVNTKPCPNPGPAGGSAADVGYICLALNGATACQAPITLTPGVLTFPPQMLVVCSTPNCSQVIQGTPATQTITLTNNSGQEQDGLTLSLSRQLPGDFNTINSFSETDTCVASGQSTFNLASGQSCIVTVSFAPQQGCLWNPIPGTPAGTAPAQCPDSRVASLSVTVPSVPNVGDNPNFTLPITGTGLSYLRPSTAELDFGAEADGEASLPQLLSFTNYGPTPVQIFGPRSNPCPYTLAGVQSLQLPLTMTEYQNGDFAGLQVVAGGQNGHSITATGGMTTFDCDVDGPAGVGTGRPNFQISSDTCTGVTLPAQTSCSLEIAFVPQPGTYGQAHSAAPLDYFLQLNTLTCSSTQTSDCEIDSARFPVELKANAPSPLRMLPAGGGDFGNVPVGKSSATQSITLFNDPADPSAATVNFVAKISVNGSYSEVDDCPFSLASGSSCTVNVTFKPKAAGLNQGRLNIFYTLGSAGAIGNEQFVYMRGRGQ